MTTYRWVSLPVAVLMLWVGLAGPVWGTYFAAAKEDTGSVPEEEDMDTLLYLSRDRDIIFRPNEVIELMGLSSGDTIVDIGAHRGYFTFTFARAVGPGGNVYASDLVYSDSLGGAKTLDWMRSKIADRRENPYDNVQIIYNRRDDLGLSENSVDMAFMCLDAIFLPSPGEIIYPMQDEYIRIQKRMVKSIYKALRPGGRLVVIDLYEGEEGSPYENPGPTSFAPFLIAKDLDDVKDRFEGEGFTLVAEYDIFMNERHNEDVERFKKLPTYRRLPPQSRFFMCNEMFFFVFQKPLK